MMSARAWRAIGLALGMLFLARSVGAQDSSARKEAGVHFQRAVTLYAEADYRAALVEFKRAQEIAPNVTVLYNLGETYYQLQNYAEALTSFERFIAEGGTQHRAEVESSISVLRTRVGKVDVTTPSAGWEISVDDEVVGKTPLARPIAVSIGRRRLSATKAGETPVSRFIEIGAGDTVAVNLGAAIAAPSKPAERAPAPAPPPPATNDGGQMNKLLLGGWIGTGALGAGAVVTGILATSKASSLKDARSHFPADKGDLDSKASSVKTLALVTDVLGGAAILLGGVTLYITLTKPSSTTTARLGTSGSELLLEGTF